MLDITLKDTKYQLPTTYREVSFGRFVAALDIVKGDGGAFRKATALIALLSSAPLADIKQSSSSELLDWNTALGFLYEKMDVDSDEPLRYFEVNGTRFFVNNLDVTGDFITYEDVIMTFKDHEYEGLPVQLALLCRREGETLDAVQTNSDLLAERIEIMKELNTEAVFRIAGFFLHREESTQQFTALSTSLATMKNQLLNQINYDLAKSTDGTKRLSTLQAASLKLIKYSL